MLFQSFFLEPSSPALPPSPCPVFLRVAPSFSLARQRSRFPSLRLDSPVLLIEVPSTASSLSPSELVSFFATHRSSLSSARHNVALSVSFPATTIVLPFLTLCIHVGLYSLSVHLPLCRPLRTFSAFAAEDAIACPYRAHVARERPMPDCPRSLMSSHRRDEISHRPRRTRGRNIPASSSATRSKRVLSLSLLTHLPTYQPTYLSYPRRTLFTAAERYRAVFVALSAGTLSPLLSRSDGSSLLVESSVSSGRFSRRFSLSLSLPRSVPRAVAVSPVINTYTATLLAP